MRWRGNTQDCTGLGELRETEHESVFSDFVTFGTCPHEVKMGNVLSHNKWGEVIYRLGFLTTDGYRSYTAGMMRR